MAMPFRVRPGESTTLFWTVRNAEEVTIEGGALPLSVVTSSGSIAYTPEEPGPEQTETFTLTARGPGGSVRTQTAVQIVELGEVRILEFTATPSRVRPQDPVRLRWRTENATAVALRLRNGTILEPAAPSAGSIVLRPEEDILIELRAEGAFGPKVATASVSARPLSPSVESFWVSPNIVRLGELVQLQWLVIGADFVEISELTDSPQTLLYSEDAAGTFAFAADEPTGLRTFGLFAQNEEGEVRETANLIVLEVEPPQILNFSVTPTITGPGGDIRIDWATSNADPVQLTANDTLLYADAPAAGSLVVPDLQIDTLLTLRAFDRGLQMEDRTALRQIPVTVDPARPQILSWTSAPSVVLAQEQVELTYATIGAERITIISEDGRALLQSATSTGTLTIFPQTSSFYWLSATNNAGETLGITSVAVFPPPKIVSFRTDPVVRLGRAARLSWEMENITAATLHFVTERPLTELQQGTLLEVPTGEAIYIALLEARSGPIFTSSSAATQVLPRAINLFDEEPNDDEATAQGPYVNVPFTLDGLINGDDIDAFEVQVPPGERLLISTMPKSGCPDGLAVEFYEYEPMLGLMGPRVMVESADSCPSLSAQLFPKIANLNSPIMIVLRPPTGADTNIPRNYQLRVTSEIGQCSDGVLDHLEQCDDRNLSPGDGCSQSCTLGDLDEIEPNNRINDATQVTLGPRYKGHLDRQDVDWYQIFVPPENVGLFSFLLEGSASGLCDLDARLTVIDEFNLEVAQDDGQGLGCAMLTAPLSVGLYWLIVEPGRGLHLPRRGPYRIGLSGP